MRGIFNGSKEGYEKGLADGVGGRPRKAIDSVGEACAHAVRPKSYTETFLRAYGKGHDDGNRKRILEEAEERAKKRAEWNKRARAEALEKARREAKARDDGRERNDGR